LSLVIGTVLLIGAAAGFVIVPEHKPRVSGSTIYLLGPDGIGPTWSRTLYDTLRITTWGFLIVGAITVAVGLISYARR
jgi:hypothetical protein